MSLGRCPLSIFCSRGTLPREVPRVCDPLSQQTLSPLMLTPDDESESGGGESDSDEEGEKKVLL